MPGPGSLSRALNALTVPLLCDFVEQAETQLNSEMATVLGRVPEVDVGLTGVDRKAQAGVRGHGGWPFFEDSLGRGLLPCTWLKAW